MTLNIAGGFSLERCASSRVSSFCCAMPLTTRPRAPRNLTIAALAQFLRAIVINVGGRCNATASTDRVDYVVFHRLARTQQPQARLLTAVGATRKRRAVFGFRLSVCH